MNQLCYLLLSLLFTPCLLFGTTLQLKQRMGGAKGGDFLVLDQCRTLLFLVVSSANERILALEEIMIPSTLFPKGRYNYRSWLEAGAPRATSWNHYEIDRTSAKLLSAYSYTQKSQLDTTNSRCFLTTLLYLPLEKIPLDRRKRTSKKNQRGEAELWQPKMVYDGQVIENVAFDGFFAHWPLDGSELSGKLVQIYLPKVEEGYPAHFPYWLELDHAVKTMKLRVIDSGRNLGTLSR